MSKNLHHLIVGIFTEGEKPVKIFILGQEYDKRFDKRIWLMFKNKSEP